MIVLALELLLKKKITTDWVVYKQQKCISYNSGGCKIEIRVGAWWSSGENSLLGSRLQTSYTLTGQRAKRSKFSLDLSTNPIREGSTLLS